MKITEQTKLVLFIIVLVVTSQLALTMYLPSMPRMVSFFKTDISHIQLSITLYLIGYGISQFIYGPLSDMYGRKKIILVGLSIFIIASIICTAAWSISIFLLGRLFQGMGIGCGDTMGRAILCDRFKGQSFVKAACHIGLAATLTPMLGPLIGGYIEAYSNWRISFLLISLYSVIALISVVYYLPETKPIHLKMIGSLRGILKTYGSVLKNRTFISFFLPGAVCFLGETLYNLMSPFLIQKQLGWGPIAFGWLNILTVAGLLMGTLAANMLAKKFSYIRMVSVGLCLLTISAISMLVPALFHYMSAAAIITPMLLFMAGVGIIYPNTNTGALSPFSSGAAGTAGALQGGLQMVLGGLMGASVGGLSTQTQLPLALILALLTLAAHTTFVLLLPRRRWAALLENT